MGILQRYFALIGAFVMICVASAANAQVVLQRQLVGQFGGYGTGNLALCPPANNLNFRISRYVGGMMQGYFRFDWTLRRDGSVIKSEQQTYDLRGNAANQYQNYTYVKEWLGNAPTPGVYQAKLEVRKRSGVYPWFNFNTVVISESSGPITISNTPATHSFKIKDASGNFVSPLANGAPISVSLSSGIILDGSASNCETGYLVIVQESNQGWNRTFLNELGMNWRNGQVPAAINLQQFVTSDSLNGGTGYFSLLGGTISSGSLAGQDRYYRVGLQAAGAPWNPQMALIRVGW